MMRRWTFINVIFFGTTVTKSKAECLLHCNTLTLQKALERAPIFGRHKRVHALEQIASVVAEELHKARFKFAVRDQLLPVLPHEGSKRLKILGAE